MTLQDTGRWPTAFRFAEGRSSPGLRRAAALTRRLARHDLFPSDARAEQFRADLFTGDPVAERFVDEVMSGPTGRALLDRALAGSVTDVPEAPESMRELFAEFERVPDWVDRDLVEEGMAIWRRWGTDLFSVAGVTTLEIYTEAAVALPLSLAGGYAGENAMRRFLETSRFWIDVSEPGALFRPGSAGRATAMLVRVMHVSVRRRVAEHPEWDTARWGLPISQAYMMLTLIGGSVAPALALSLLGHQTGPREMRALLAFQRYLGHLLGVHPRLFPDSVRECLQVLAMTIAARSDDAGVHGAELIESFPTAFAPRPGLHGLDRLRALGEYRLHAAHLGLWMAPATRRRYDLPSPFPWILLPLARFPLVAAREMVRRVVPGLDRALQRRGSRRREQWLQRRLAGRQAQFAASSGLRR